MRTYRSCIGAAARVREGWAWRRWRNDNGDPCMLQALLDAMGLGHGAQGAQLPRNVQLALDEVLMRRPDYRFNVKLQSMRLRARMSGKSLQKAHYSWNDLAGRTMEEVAQVLDELAEEMKPRIVRDLPRLLATAIRPVNQSYYDTESADELELTHA